MQALADELMAVADMPSSRVLDQAAEIDRFCAAVDLEIGVNLVSRASAFTGTKIRALAEAAGMVLGINGLFTRYDDAGRAQFSLQNYESTQFSADSVRTLTTHGLTFVLDVPCVDHGERVFMQMTELAKRFAETLQGALVDDNRQPLSDSQLDHIRREFIGKPQATMHSFGVPAGSAQALRLFS
jgi:FtsZ-interacting cell division protein ZipA